MRFLANEAKQESQKLLDEFTLEMYHVYKSKGPKYIKYLNPNPERTWSLNNALFFTTTTISTIGEKFLSIKKCNLKHFIY